MRRHPLLTAVGTGVVAGLAARGLFTVLPPPWDTLANTSALWGLVGAAAVLLTRERRAVRAALHGATALVAMVAVFATTSSAVGARELVLWVTVGTAAGAIFGVAASRFPDWRAVGGAGGVIVGEAVYGLVLIGGPQWWLELALGLAIPCAARRRAPAVAVALVLAVGLFGAYLLYDSLAVA